MIAAVCAYALAVLFIWRAQDDRLADCDAAIWMLCGKGLAVAGTLPLLHGVAA